MKWNFFAATLSVVLPIASIAALAQGDDGVQNAGPQQYWAPADKYSDAINKPLAGAVNQGKFDMKTWKYGPAANIPPGATRIWNPAMIKLKNGGKLFSATVSGSATPEAYCTEAVKPENDFIWTEMQHAPGTWHDVANMWAGCPAAHAIPGARISYENEREEQQALDGGALWLSVPTIRNPQEAQLAANWAFYPPLGHRSNGGGAANMWSKLSGGNYRQTINDNLILVLMIETLDGIASAEKIAQTKGITAVFAASGDLGNFSGYSQGSPDYERLINVVHDAAIKAKIHLCGPGAWANRPNFTCFQGNLPVPGGRRGGRGGAAPAAAQ
jgi:2-keto-3-deoxy-L-rhamnonate aldolase RhmA